MDFKISETNKGKRSLIHIHIELTINRRQVVQLGDVQTKPVKMLSRLALKKKIRLSPSTWNIITSRTMF